MKYLVVDFGIHNSEKLELILDLHLELEDEGICFWYLVLYLQFSEIQLKILAFLKDLIFCREFLKLTFIEEFTVMNKDADI